MELEALPGWLDRGRQGADLTASQGTLEPAAGLQVSPFALGKVPVRLAAALTEQSILTLRLMSFRSTSCPSRMPVTSACTISLMALTLACRSRQELCWRAWQADACVQHEHCNAGSLSVPPEPYLFGRQDCRFGLHG